MPSSSRTERSAHVDAFVTIGLIVCVLMAVGSCLEPIKYPKSEKYGFEYSGPTELLFYVELAWEPFDEAGVKAPWMVTVLNDRQKVKCGCEGSWGWGGSVKTGESLCSLPHEYAHQASNDLYGHPQADHQWSPVVRELLNKAADAVGCGHEFE